MEARLKQVESLVNDERACVTVKWLSFEFGINSHEAKMLLHSFVKTRPTSENLSVTYLVSGIDKNQLLVRLVNGQEKLNALKQQMQRVVSMHVYAVEAYHKAEAATTSQTLWNVDHTKVSEAAQNQENVEPAPLLKNTFGTIKCESLVVAPQRQVAVPKKSASPVKKSSVYASSKQPKIKAATTATAFFAKSKAKSEPTGKAAKKKQSAKGFFNKKEGDKKGDTKKVEEKDDEDVVAVDEDNEAPKTSQKRSRNVIDSDSESDSGSESDEYEFGEEAGNAKKKRKSKSKSKKRKLQLTKEELEKKEQERKEASRQKRAQRTEELRAERQKRLQAEAKEAKARFADSLGVKAKKEDDSASSSGGGVRTKIVKKLVQKEFVDEKGYLVTKDVVEEVEVPIEDEVVPKAKPQAKANAKPNTKEKAKKPAKTKQKSMLAFFKKK